MSTFGFQVLKGSLTLTRQVFGHQVVPKRLGRQVLENATRWVRLPKNLVSQPVAPAEETFTGLWVRDLRRTTRQTILYLHGGGYHIGSANTHQRLTYRLGQAAEAQVFSLNYRMAPEHPFPAALEDSARAYDWLCEQGFAPEEIILAGDSAGGGLVLSTLMYLRDHDKPLPAGALCLSPWADLAVTGQSVRTRGNLDPWLAEQNIREWADSYLDGASPRDPLASPLYGDFRDLPPVLIHVGDHEVLLDDARRVARKARDEGVEVTLKIWPEMIHVFQAFDRVLPQARQSIREMGEFARARYEAAAAEENGSGLLSKIGQLTRQNFFAG